MGDEDRINPSAEDYTEVVDIGVEPGTEPIENVPEVEEYDPPEAVEDQPEEKPQEPDFKQLYSNTKKRYDAILDISKKYIDPDLHQTFKQEIGDKAFQEPSKPDYTDLEGESLFEMDPSKFFGKIGQQMESIVEQKLAARERAQAEANMKKQYVSEVNETDTALKAFIKDGEFSKEQVNEAYAEMESYGLDLNKPGNYSRAARIVSKHLQLLQLQGANRGRTTKLEAEIANQVKNANQTLQPSDAAVPEQPTKTFQDQLIADMKKVKKPELSSLPK